MSRFLAFLRRDFLVDVSYPWFWVSQLILILGQLVLLVAAARMVSGRSVPGVETDYFSWVLIGNAGAMVFTMALSASSSRLRQEQFSGTLEVLFTSRTPFTQAVLYSAAYSLLRLTPQTLVLVGIAWWFGPRQAGPLHLAMAACFFVGALALFAGLGILAAAAVLVWQRGDFVVRLIAGMAILFGTAYFPAQVLPGPLAYLPRFVPLTPTLAGLRGGILGTLPPEQLVAPLIIVLLEAAILFPLGLAAFKRGLTAARRSGALAKY